jgi:predicted transcriptional regulator
MSITSVRLPPEIDHALSDTAQKLQRSKSWLINQALKEFLEREKLLQRRWDETAEAMESVAAGRVISGDAVHQWLQSWGSEVELMAPKVGQ